MTNHSDTKSILNAHVHTLALHSAGHPGTLRYIMGGQTDAARLNLRTHIRSMLAMPDAALAAHVSAPVRASITLLRDMPGPLLASAIDEVVEAIIP